MDSKKVAVAYIPVLHKGYINYLDELVEQGVHTLYLISDEILSAHEELDYIHRKDRIRAVPQEFMHRLLKEVVPIEVLLLDSSSIQDIQHEKATIITPKEDIGRFVVEKFFHDHEVIYSNVFLRRNEANTKKDIEPEGTQEISASDFQKKMFELARDAADKSADWWRHVGAVLSKDGEVLCVAHNEHMPEEQLPNIEGDLRSLFKKGINMNYVTTAHAEASVIATAARKGVSTEGAELYVTDYPCPYCMRVIAKSGITKMYFLNGYAVLENDGLFEAMGIEAIKVRMENEEK